MFISDEFEKWCAELSLSDATIELIKRIRENDPSRRVGGGRRNVVGAYPSHKMGMSIQFESHKVELPGLYLKEHDASVKEYYDQPPAIKLKYRSISEKVTALYHTPDFFVIYEDKAGWEEWKSEEDLWKLAQESPNRYVFIDGQWHCPPGEEYAEQFGLSYWLKSSGEINWSFQRNIIFLEDYLLDTGRNLPEEKANMVLEYVCSEQGVLLSDLLNKPGFEPDIIYYMIAKNLIYVDLYKEVLTEPEEAHIFKDKISCTARQILLSQKKVPAIYSSSINIAPNVKFEWDRQSWTILNVGENNICITSDNKVVNIQKSLFLSLAADHQIRGIEQMDPAISSPMIYANEQSLIEANRRYNIILPLIKGGSAKDIGYGDVTDRTLRNWMRNYKQAEILYGAGFVGLIPNTNHRGNRAPHLPDETLSIINTFLDENETAANQSVSLLFGKLQHLCESKRVICPSYKSFCKIIRSRPKYDRMKKTLGSRAAYQHAPFYWSLDMTTPKHGERPFEIAHIDHTQLDIRLIDSKTEKQSDKPWLTVMMDSFSRRILAFHLTFDPPSYRSDMMVIQECVKRFNRLPQTIVTDGGRDFRSIYYESLLAFYSVTRKLRPPHKARFGSEIERLFGTTLSQIIHNLKGNTKAMKNPRMVSSSFNPAKHAIWTLPALYELLYSFFYDFYDKRDHSALCESPKEAFERDMRTSGTRPFRFIPYDDEFSILTLPAAKRNNGTGKIDPQRGIKVNGFYYFNDQFSRPSLDGVRVPIRYDPNNMGIVYCYIKNKWVKCYSEQYSILKNKTEKQILMASEEIRKRKKDHAAKSGIRAKELAEFFFQAESIENELSLKREQACEEPPTLYLINGRQEDLHEKECAVAKDPDFYAKLDFTLDD
jgi:transposase InsO family protein